MRISSFLRLYEAPPEAFVCATADGRHLRIDGRIADRLLFEVAFERLGCDDELPREGFTQTLWLPDADGVVWTATLHHAASDLMRLMAEAIQDRGLSVLDTAPDEVADLFIEHPVLEGIAYSSDDRLPHLYWIDDVILTATNKHAVFLFDIAGEPYTPAASFPHGQFHVRVREGPLFDESRRHESIRTTSELPALIFPLSLPDLWRRTGIYTEEGCWHPTVFPAPIVFHSTNEHGASQPCVRVM